MPQTVKKRTFKSAALQYTYDRYIGNDPKRIQEYEEEVVNAEIARRVYDLRTKAGLSQRELAKRVGTSASAIAVTNHEIEEIWRLVPDGTRVVIKP